MVVAAAKITFPFIIRRDLEKKEHFQTTPTNLAQ